MSESYLASALRNTLLFFKDKIGDQHGWRLDLASRFDLHMKWMTEVLARVHWKPDAGFKENAKGKAIYLYNADDACVLPAVRPHKQVV
jgi:hypothetical protein